MESKKDIGSYFKENLEQLDYSPSTKVWEGIEVELKEKKKKRRFVFWLCFSVVTICGLSTYTYFNHSNSEKPSTNNVVTTDTNNRNTNSNNTNSDNNNLNNPDSNNSDSNNPILSIPKEKTNNEFKENEVVNDKKNKAEKNNLNTNGNSGLTNNSENARTKNKVSNRKPNNSVGIVDENKNLKNNLSKKSKKFNHKKGFKTTESGASLFAKTRQQSKKAKKSNKAKPSDISNKSNETNNLNDLKTDGNNNALASDKDKKLSIDDLKKANQKKRDSLVAARKTEKEKKDLVQKPKEEEKDSTTVIVTESGHEIIIAPYVGFNYTGNFGNGNFLNDSKTSKKTSQFNTSYGVLVRIMGNKKIGLQIGAGIINSVYSATFTKESNNFISANNVSLNVSLQELNNQFPNGTEITSRQETTFIEVPLEAYYILSDKKFGIATSFGISFLKFQNNELFLESDTIDRLKVGTLENVSPFSSSINVKLNFFYKITKKLQFDLYPSFQYQFMGYKDVSNYHPYFISIKTGLSYKL